MKNFAVIGFPIEHSLSPILHQEIYNELGQKITSRKVSVNTKSLSRFVKSKRSNFYNVTIPHKENIISLLDSLESSAKKIGAVNCVDFT